MQKITSSLKKTDLFSEKKHSLSSQQLQPRADTLQKILQFASCYRVEQSGQNHFVELFLN